MRASEIRNLSKRSFTLGNGGAELRSEPARRHFSHCGLSGGIVDLPAFDEAERVPNLVAEIAALLYKLVIVHDVVAGRGCEHEAHAHAVGTVIADKVKRIGRVSEHLAHLAAYGVAHDAGEVNVVEGCLPTYS